MPRRDGEQLEYLNEKDAAEDREKKKGGEENTDPDDQRRKERVESSLITDAFGH